jgi:hypothetical protein
LPGNFSGAGQCNCTTYCFTVLNALVLKAGKNYSYMPSTVIRLMNYNAESGTLRITFTTGLVYDYKKVPEDEYFALKISFAKGIYFNQHIKDKYECEKVE